MPACIHPSKCLWALQSLRQQLLYVQQNWNHGLIQTDSERTSYLRSTTCIDAQALPAQALTHVRGRGVHVPTKHRQLHEQQCTAPLVRLPILRVVARLQGA